MPLSPALQAFLSQLRGSVADGVGNILSDAALFREAITELSEGAIEVQDDGVQIVDVASLLDFRGAGVVVTDQGGGNARVTISGGAGGALNFEEEGAAVVTATILNATGLGVTITDVAGVATITVPGTIDFRDQGSLVVSSTIFNVIGIGGRLLEIGGVATLNLTGIVYQEEGAGIVEAVIVNFVGSGVTLTDVAGVATVTIAGGLTAWEEEGAAIVSSGTANFVGAGATVTDAAGVATITIPGELPTLLVTDQKANNVDGGTSLTATQNLRDLNTIEKNTITGASLAANQVTLPAGDYRVSALSSGGLSLLRVKLRLRDTTANANLVIGLNLLIDQSDPGAYTCVLNGFFTLAVESVLELQMWTQLGATTNGMGVAGNSGDPEIYTTLQFEKLD